MADGFSCYVQRGRGGLPETAEAEAKRERAEVRMENFILVVVGLG